MLRPSPTTGTTKGCEIKTCTCEHPYQDKKYGPKQRVMNPNKNGYKCTVCGRPHN